MNRYIKKIEALREQFYANKTYTQNGPYGKTTFVKNMQTKVGSRSDMQFYLNIDRYISKHML